MFADRLQRAVESDARRALATALIPAPGPKALLVDDTLYDNRLSIARPLDLFTDATFLREHGIRTIAPLSSHASRSTAADALAHPTLVILIRSINATAAHHAVKAIRLVRQRTAAAAPAPASKDKAKTTKRPPVSAEDVAKAVTSTPSSVPSDTPTSKCLVLTTPRHSPIVQKILRSAGLPDVPIFPLPLGFLPFDADLVTLDWPDAHRQIVLDGDNSSILATATALSTLATTLHIEYATIRSAGAAATAVAEELLHTHGQRYANAHRSAGGGGSGGGSDRASSSASSPSSVTPSGHVDTFLPNDAFVLPDNMDKSERGPHTTTSTENGNTTTATTTMSTLTLADVVNNNTSRRNVTLVLIDRGVDVVSPLLTQWTYEGLLDEAVGLHNNVMDLPVSSIISEDAMGILSAGPSASGTVRKRLRSDVDRIFARLRDLNYWTAARQIGTVATSVRDYYDRRPTRDTAKIAQVRDYVKGLREVKSEHLSAAAHTAIAAEISARTFDSYEFKRRFELEREMIEGSNATGRRVYVTDAIARGVCLSHVVRLCCLWSVTSGGIDGEELDFVKREIVANFGLGVLPLLGNLERAGMLSRRVQEIVPSNLSWIPLPRLVAPAGVRESVSEGGSSSSHGGKAGSRGGSTGGGSSAGGSGVGDGDGGADDESVRSGGSGEEGIGRRRGGMFGGGRRPTGEYSWQFARAALRLVTEFDPEREVRAGTVAAVCAPYSGYTPLSVRLVETALCEEGWGGLPPVAAHTSLLPPGHATVEHRRGRLGDGGGGDGGSRGPKAKGEERIDAVVVMVGGIARAEASAVRLAAKAAGVRAVIASTAVMGPDEFVISLNGGMNG